MDRMRRVMWRAGLLYGAIAACSDHRDAQRELRSSAGPGTGHTSASQDTRADLRLEQSARHWIEFLRGERPFDADALADTVEIRAAPEGGGGTNRVARDTLRDRSAWVVESAGRRIRLVPPAGFSIVAIKAGRHVNCQEHDLATRAPDLASRPHVGVRLGPRSVQSCLQTWNATFVFDTTGHAPRLTTIVYDQWEW